MEAGKVNKSDPSEKPWSGAWPPAGAGHQQPLATSSLLSKAEPKTWVWEKKGLVSRRAGTELPLPHK